MTQTENCVTCGMPLVPVVYGMPGPEARDAEARGEVLLGGCSIRVGADRKGCPACGLADQDASPFDLAVSPAATTSTQHRRNLP